MSRYPHFKVGDDVVYVNDITCVENELELGRDYKVISLHADPTFIYLEGIDRCWDSIRFEHFDEWSKHQRKVDPATELELTKQQVAMLQELKYDTQQALDDLYCAIRDGADKEWLLAFMKQYPFNVEVSE